MGVTKLWTIVEDAGRPVRLESLRKKRLAIDALIWVYQFLKAVRNKEGIGLQGSHIVGFFRRICKLIYWGILPVFVFDGGAPIIKLNTIAKRRERREGQRKSAKGTAQKLLLMKLQREKENKKDTKQESQGPIVFRKEDEYHLPEIEKFYHQKTDGRIISPDDYRKYMESLDSDIDNIDLNSIDPASKEFDELPLEKQYIILHKLRLRSRLRMGYSKEQLQEIFSNSMDFSKFQVQMVAKRNFLTQKLLNVVGLDDRLPELSTKTRGVAGERDKAYTLQRTMIGWSLSLDQAGSSAENAIELDKPKKQTSDDESDDFEWEDVKIEAKPRENFSLNAMPLPPAAELTGLSKAALISIQHREKAEEEQMENLLLKKSVQASLEEEDQKYQEELKRAIEVSKRDLEKIREEQEKFIDEDLVDLGGEIEKKNTVAKPAPIPKFSFQNSIFAKNEKVADKVAELEEKPEDNKLQEKEEETVKLPLWFGNDSTSKEVHHSQKYFPLETLDTEREGLIENFNFEEQGKDLIEDTQENQQVVELGGKESVIIELSDDENDQKPSVIEVEEDDRTQATAEANANTELKVRGKDAVQQPIAEMKERPSGINKKSQTIGTRKSKKRKLETPILEVEPKRVPKCTMESEVNDHKIESPVQTVEGKLDGDKNLETRHTDNISQIKHNTSERQTDGEVDNEIDDDLEKEMNEKAEKKKIIEYEFDEEEEEDLLNDLQREEETNREFTNTLRQQYKPVQPSLPSFNYNEGDLREQHKRELRDSDEVTEQMIDEVKDLLTCFGIPFITAPMEAEAQCAKLLQLNLVDGIVTDDSDCFLFGGDKVYRHMFSEKKYAEFYTMEAIKENVNIDRDCMIELAYLLGSDYTEGLKGIGPALAPKILKEFGNLTGFRRWCMKVQSAKDLEGLLNTPFKKSLRKRLITNEIFLDEKFPDRHVRDAYIHPEVDADETKFVWGAPDLDMLRIYLKGKIGWSKEKSDEVLIPLIRRYNSPW